MGSKFNEYERMFIDHLDSIWWFEQVQQDLLSHRQGVVNCCRNDLEDLKNLPPYPIRLIEILDLSFSGYSGDCIIAYRAVCDDGNIRELKAIYFSYSIEPDDFSFGYGYTYRAGVPSVLSHDTAELYE